MRKAAVEYLQKLGWDVVVVMPNYNSNKLKVENNIHLIPYNKNQRLAFWFERIGIYEDYLDEWVKNAFFYLKNKVTKNDIVFATTGGELGTIKLGSILKKEIGCKFVINFRDPLDYSIVNGLKLDKKFHVSREKQEKKYVSNSDLIITSSNTYKNALKKKYPFLKIVNNYFGYIKKIDLNSFNKIKSDKIRIAYAGNMGKTQKPETLYEIYKKLKRNDVELYFIGNFSNNKILKNIKDKNVKLISYLEHNEFIKFMIENIDIGFVSLSNDYLGACVPSKIYEYINLGLPIFGALPDGDGKDLINKNKFGMAKKYNNIKELVEALNLMLKNENIKFFKNNILKERDKWSMEYRIKEEENLLKRLLIEN